MRMTECKVVWLCSDCKKTEKVRTVLTHFEIFSLDIALTRCILMNINGPLEIIWKEPIEMLSGCQMAGMAGLNETQRPLGRPEEVGEQKHSFRKYTRTSPNTI